MIQQKAKNPMVKTKKNLENKTFGRLKVLNQTDDYISPDGRHHCVWMCQCNCEKHTLLKVRASQLQSGKTQSCGCLRSDRTAESNKTKKKKYNTYDLSGNYGIGYTQKGEEFYFDIEDYDKIKNHYWRISPAGYVCGKRLDNSDVDVMFHRIIMSVSDKSHYEVEVDHIHGKKNRNDNRKSNLRLATNSQNQMNKGIRKDNISGVTGVCWNKRQNAWHARIRINNKEIHLGYFKKFEAAVKARKEAEKKYFGNFSYDFSRKC